MEVFEPKPHTWGKSTVKLYLRGVDDFTQRPHQGTVHSHQLLGLYLVSLVQHNPGTKSRVDLKARRHSRSINIKRADKHLASAVPDLVFVVLQGLYHFGELVRYV